MCIKIITKNGNYSVSCSEEYFELFKKSKTVFGEEILSIQII